MQAFNARRRTRRPAFAENLEAFGGAYQLPLLGQPNLPSVSQVRVTAPVLDLLMRKMLPVFDNQRDAKRFMIGWHVDEEQYYASPAMTYGADRPSTHDAVLHGSHEIGAVP